MKTKNIIVPLLILVAAYLSAGTISAQEVVSPAGETSTETASEEKLPEMKVHRVSEGEDLHMLAAKYYGNPRLWHIIYEANKNNISNPSLIYPGQIIYIPKEYK